MNLAILSSSPVVGMKMLKNGQSFAEQTLGLQGSPFAQKESFVVCNVCSKGIDKCNTVVESVELKQSPGLDLDDRNTGNILAMAGQKQFSARQCTLGVDGQQPEGMINISARDSTSGRPVEQHLSQVQWPLLLSSAASLMERPPRQGRIRSQWRRVPAGWQMV
ncbi:MAG: hypothetical protein OXC07_05375 [Kistimonas sp.]|nr:hypothetical protein [Kistimonas sp.]